MWSSRSRVGFLTLRSENSKNQSTTGGKRDFVSEPDILTSQTDPKRQRDPFTFLLMASQVSTNLRNINPESAQLSVGQYPAKVKESRIQVGPRIEVERDMFLASAHQVHGVGNRYASLP